MPQKKPKRNTLALTVVILLQAAYSALLYYHIPITGTRQWDGIIAVLLGLYACTYPAANVIDLLFYDHGQSFQGQSWQGKAGWWALNVLVLFAGWVVISLGLIRFTAR